MTVKHPLFRVLARLGLLLAALCALELLLQGLSLFLGGSIGRSLNEITTFDIGGEDAWWMRRFLVQYGDLADAAIPMSQNEYRPHSRLGWVPRSSISITNSLEQRYTTNSSGCRSLREYQANANKFTVLVVGDSFTYGSWADDAEVWPTLLGGLNTNLNVLNFGVGGYGVDQMALMAEAQLEQFVPEMVIVAFISDDLHRSTLRFRGYWKPTFVLKEGELQLTGCPVPQLWEGVKQADREVRRVDMLSRVTRLRIVGSLMNACVKLFDYPCQSPSEREYQELNTRIFERIIATNKAHGVATLLLWLPWGDELKSAAFRRRGEQFVEEFLADHRVDYLNPRERFLATDKTYSDGHYRGAGASVVANAVHEFILGHSSFLAWRTRRREPE